MERRNWTRDELVVAFNHYCKLPFGQLHAKNPRIISLAKLLDRTPGSLAMKLVNFAALDPTHQKRGISGLKNTSKADQAIWNEFNGNWTDLAAESERASRQRQGAEIPNPEALATADSAEPPAETERESWVTVRLGQSFFRDTILASYGTRCCVCNLHVESLLVASHIVPWAARPDLRVNPRNGLCLCALHDRAFDRGLVTIDVRMSMTLSPRLEQYLPDDVVEKMFVAYRDVLIRLPEKFSPSPEYLDYHRSTIYQKA